MSRKTKVLVLLCLDSLVVLIANLFSYIYMVPYVSMDKKFLLTAVSIQLIVYVVFGFIFKVFTRINRYTNLSEIIAIFGATSFSAMIEFIVLFFMDDVHSRRFVLLTYLLTTFFIISSRLCWRLIVEKKNRSLNSNAKKP